MSVNSTKTPPDTFEVHESIHMQRYMQSVIETRQRKTTAPEDSSFSGEK